MNPGLPGILVPLLVWGAGHAQEAPPVVMVADVSGRASHRGGRSLVLAEGIPPWRELRLEPGAKLVVIHLRTGEELHFAGPATLRFDGAGEPQGAKPSSRRRVAGLQGSFRLEPGAWAQASVVIRKEFMPGGPPQLEPERPLPFPSEQDSGTRLRPRGAVLLDDRPAFRWQPPAPDAEAHFRLADAVGVVVMEGRLTEEGLRPMEVLQRGADYRWRLVWTVAGGQEEAVEGGFRVATAAEAEQARRARPEPEASFAERLAYAVALETRGLEEEAQPWWVALAKERPEDGTLRRFAER